PASTSEMSEDTPPVSGVILGRSSAPRRPIRRRGSIRSRASAAGSGPRSALTQASIGGAPAGEVKARAGRERTFLARKPADKRRGFLDGAEPLHRNLRAHIGDMGRRGLFEDRRVDDGGRDGVDGDAILGELLAERLGEADDRGLGGAIGAGARVALLAGDRGDVDDAPVAPPLHQPGDRTVAVEEAIDVDVEDALPFVDRIVDGLGVLARHSRRADERVDLSHRLVARLSRALDVGRIGDVDPLGPALFAKLAGGGLQPRGIVVPYADPTALGDEPARGRKADPRRAACHDRRHSLKALRVRHSQPSCCSRLFLYPGNSVSPPSTRRTWPLIYLLRGPARKATAS